MRITKNISNWISKQITVMVYYGNLIEIEKTNQRGRGVKLWTSQSAVKFSTNELFLLIKENEIEMKRCKDVDLLTYSI